MPSTLPRPCNAIGCRATTTHGRFCHAHQQQYERQRGTSTARGYGSQWSRIRAQVLAEHAACVMCGLPATQVDHIIPLSKGGTNDRWNLQSLCRKCHGRKHGDARMQT